MVRLKPGFQCDLGSYVELLDLIESYLNGPRTLSNERLSYLIVSRTPAKLPTPPSTPRNAEVLPVWSSERLTDDNPVDYELFICAAHSIGDGMALHQFANDFFGLLGSARSQEAMEQLVADEWKQRWGRLIPADVRLSQWCYYCSAEVVNRPQPFRRVWKKTWEQIRAGSGAPPGASTFRIIWTTRL
jgi:hypothetical protein